MNSTDFYTLPGCSLVEFAEKCGHLAAQKIERFVNRGGAKSTNSQKGMLVNKKPFAAQKLKSVSDTTRKQASQGNFFQFSACDKEEITSLAALILAQNNAFPDCLGPYAVSKNIIDQIKEAIKGRDGLELNRYRNKRKIQMGIRGESVAGIMDCDLASLPELNDRLIECPYTDKQEKIIAVITNKTEPIIKCLTAFHSQSESRKAKAALKSDIAFFHTLTSKSECGNGKTRTAFIERRKVFMQNLSEGFTYLKRQEKFVFSSFDELAAVF